MKKNAFIFCLLVLLAFPLGLTAKNPEIFTSVGSQYLYEDTRIFFEVRDIASNRFRWEFGDGSVETGGKKMDHVFKARGTYNIRVTDLEGNFPKPIMKRIRIVKDDREIVFTGQVFYPGIPVQMKARSFIDMSIRWNFGDGTEQNLGRNVSHTYTRGGTYTVKAIDLAGKDVKEISKAIRINEDNRSIVVPQEIIEGEAAEMQLKNTQGGNYTWEFSDGQRASGLSIKTVVFKRPGTVTVTVKDSSGNYPPLAQQLIVKPDKRKLKTTLAFALPEEDVRFEAEGFRGPVMWDFGDGTIKNNGSKTETHQYKEPGTYKVTVRDLNGKSQKPFTTSVTVNELSPDFQLTYLEMAFSNGKYYEVAPLKNQPPLYYVKMKAIGRGILRGRWVLDGQTIGLFQVLLHQGKLADLRGTHVVSLPMRDLGIHDLTLEFTNYNFPQRIPIIRYFVTEADALRIVFPEPGTKVTASAAKPLQLKWEPVDPRIHKKWDITYQILVSETPLQFLTDEQMSWQDVGSEQQYSPDLSPFREKDQLWLYWQVRALKPNGDVLTLSEISSFKLVL